MRRLAVVLLLVLAACAPQVQPSIERDGERVAITISVDSERPLFNATMSVLNATTEDERCHAIDSDLACILGDLHGSTVVTVTGTEVKCVVFGYISPVLTLQNYRPFQCKLGG